MKIIPTLLALLVLAACGKEHKFPSGFSGHWEMEYEGVEYRIKVTENGVWTYDGMPEHVKLQLRVLEKNDAGYILETTNTLNPEPKQYTLNRIENETWVVTMLNEDLSEMEGVPQNLWNPIKKR